MRRFSMSVLAGLIASLLGFIVGFVISQPIIVFHASGQGRDIFVNMRNVGFSAATSTAFTLTVRERMSGRHELIKAYWPSGLQAPDLFEIRPFKDATLIHFDDRGKLDEFETLEILKVLFFGDDRAGRNDVISVSLNIKREKNVLSFPVYDPDKFLQAALFVVLIVFVTSLCYTVLGWFVRLLKNDG